MEEFRNTIEKIDEEIGRVKTWANENGFHSGTSVNLVLRNYRTELKKLRRVLADNLPEAM